MDEEIRKMLEAIIEGQKESNNKISGIDIKIDHLKESITQDVKNIYKEMDKNRNEILNKWASIEAQLISLNASIDSKHSYVKKMLEEQARYLRQRIEAVEDVIE